MADTPSRSLFARGLRLLRRRLRGLRWAAKRISGLPVHIHIESRWRLGDEILAIPFYRLVRERYPAATITVAVNHPELLEGNGDVSVDSNRSEFACDRHILATCEGRPETRLEHLCRIHRIPYRPLEPAIRPPEFAAGADLRGDPLIAVSTGAGWACKSWPAAHVARFARLLREALPDAVFVEVGKGCPTAGVGRSFIDALSVRETAAVLAKAALYVGPDSGLLHLALAVGTPAVGLFGPVFPAAAFGPRRTLCPIQSPAPCAGCWTERRMSTPGSCPLGVTGPDPAAYPCMRSLEPEAVCARILETRPWRVRT